MYLWPTYVYAIRHRNIRVAEITCNDIRRPVIIAVSAGHLNVIQLLIDHNAPVDQPNKSGMTPAMMAIFNRRAECAMLLAKHGADIFNRDFNDPRVDKSMEDYLEEIRRNVTRELLTNTVALNYLGEEHHTDHTVSLGL